jgi:hypothetical protein
VQKAVLRALIGSLEFETWMRNRVLKIPAEKREALAKRLNISNGSIEVVEFELQNSLLRELQGLVK